MADKGIVKAANEIMGATPEQVMELNEALTEVASVMSDAVTELEITNRQLNKISEIKTKYDDQVKRARRKMMDLATRL
jgi:hypothetical protein